MPSIQPDVGVLVELTPRQQREREYYDAYSQKKVDIEIDFAPVLGQERRPWNSYWFLYGLVRDFAATGADRTLLDIGCGPGYDCIRYAKLGYRVHGIDIAPGNIAVSAQLAEKYGVQDRVQTRTMPSERLDFPDATFDVVTGVDILHHVEVDQTVAEAMRVLKPGGVAVFKECVELPILDPIYQALTGRLHGRRKLSPDVHSTQDERKLNRRDLAAMRATCPGLIMRRFYLLSRFNRFLKRRGGGSRSLERLDWRLIRAFPPLGRLGGWAVFEMRKPPR